MTMFLRSAMADELDERAQEFMSRHDEVSYLQALRAILPEENPMSKYTPAAAGVDVDARAKRYVATHQGSTYQEAVHAVLAADKQLAAAYAAPATRRRVSTLATVDPRSQPAVPIAPAEEAEITGWIMRAITDGKPGELPGALGSLAVEADKFARLGMPAAEAARRAMGLFPHLVSLSKILLVDVRRNAPENKPRTETVAAQSPAEIVDLRVKALTEKHPHLDYKEAMGAVFAEDPALKQRYAGVQS